MNIVKDLNYTHSFNFLWQLEVTDGVCKFWMGKISITFWVSTRELLLLLSFRLKSKASTLTFFFSNYRLSSLSSLDWQTKLHPMQAVSPSWAVLLSLQSIQPSSPISLTLSLSLIPYCCSSHPFKIWASSKILLSPFPFPSNPASDPDGLSLSLPSHQRGSDMPPHKHCCFGISSWAQVTWETVDARGAPCPAPLSLRAGHMTSSEKSAFKAPGREVLSYHWRLGVIPKLNRYKQPKQSWSSTRFPHLFPDQSVSQFSRSGVSDSLRAHESQHTRPPCPSPTPGVYSNSLTHNSLSQLKPLCLITLQIYCSFA